MFIFHPSDNFTFHDDLAMTLLNSDSRPVIDILLVGLGSIGTVYAYILEKVSSASCRPFAVADDTPRAVELGSLPSPAPTMAYTHQRA